MDAARRCPPLHAVLEWMVRAPWVWWRPHPALLCDSGSSPLAFLPGEYQSSQGRGYPIPAGLPVGANVNVWYGVPYPRGFCLALVEDFPLGCSGPSFRLVLGARCDLVYALRTCGLGLLGGCLSCLSLYSLH
jgi:hypothetical protein